ncbi:MAG: OmpA family protein [Nevskia sp.]|nr:OmpA family protein [Nevskia sp.]
MTSSTQNLPIIAGIMLLSACAATAPPMGSSSVERARWYSNQGFEKIREHDYDAAKTNLDKALEIEPKLPIAHLNLGWVYEETGKCPEAKEQYDLAIAEEKAGDYPGFSHTLQGPNDKNLTVTKIANANLDKLSKECQLQTAQTNAASATPPSPAPQAAVPAPAQYLVYFERNTDVLTAESVGQFANIKSQLVRRATQVQVIGHTDTLGSMAKNEALSQRRAAFVKSALVAAGLPADRISASALGEREPLVPTADGVAEPRNRCVVIRVR